MQTGPLQIMDAKICQVFWDCISERLNVLLQHAVLLLARFGVSVLPGRVQPSSAGCYTATGHTGIFSAAATVIVPLRDAPAAAFQGCSSACHDLVAAGPMCLLQAWLTSDECEY
jgi:hypothetical protein